MYYLYSFRDFILIIVFFVLIIGLIRPSIVIRWGSKKTRGRVLLYYGLGMILLTVIPDLLKPEEIWERERQESAKQWHKKQQQKEKEKQEQLQQAQPILEQRYIQKLWMSKRKERIL